MLICRILVLGCLLKTGLTFRVDEGCEAKAEWRETFKWREFHINTWTPPNKKEILELKMIFEDYEDALYNDKIILYKDSYELNKERDMKPTTTLTNTSVEIKDGWLNFIFVADDHYKVWYVDSNRTSLLLKEKVDFKLKSLILKGSNITLNCPSELYMWLVSDRPVPIPLHNSNEHWISFYSNGHMVPSITLESKELTLRWDGQAITTLKKNMQRLPPFQQHNITIVCNDDREIYCIVQVGKNKKEIEKIRLGKLPELILIGKKGDPFSVLLLESDPYPDIYPEITTDIIFPEITVAKGNGTVTTLAIILAIAVFAWAATSFLAWHYRSKVKKLSDENIEAAKNYDPEKMPLIQFMDSTVTRIEENPLLDAVVQKSPQIVKILLDTVRSNTEAYKMAYVEAHLLCRKDIIKVFESNSSLERENIISLVQKEYNYRVDTVFEKAKKGCYLRGIDQLLRCYELPATIRDEKGRSILHVIASAKDSDERPVWNAGNIRTFLKNNACYPNAVDFEGQTCLHHLVNAASNSKTSVTWDGKEMSAESAWVSMAKILVKFGCDPRRKDAKGRLPHQCAKEIRHLELSTYLEERYDNIDAINNENASFADLLKHAKAGNTTSLMELMKCHQELLPLKATEDPLTVSATRGHLEATLLLLSGGAWICGRSVISITPLEAVHGVKSLPAVFPALMRRECVNRLRYEILKITSDKTFEKLHKHVEDLISEVENGGITSLSLKHTDDQDEEKSKDSRELLCMAAGLGMSLTCQMLGIECVNIQPLPEERKPVLKAIENGQQEVIYVLYRDLEMSIFPLVDKKKLRDEFLQEMWTSEYNQLKKVCEMREDSTHYKKWLNKVSEAHNGSEVDMIEKEVLLHISQQGLVYIFHDMIKNVKKFDINDVIDDVTGCTLLHIAAMYGCFSMVEYLLYDKSVDVMTKSKGGFTAAHMAAIKGNKDCMKYLQNCMKKDQEKDDDESKGGQTASQLINGYQAQVTDFEFVFLPDMDGLEVWSEPFVKDKIKISLEKKCLQYDVQDKLSFEEFIKKYTKKENLTCEKILEEINILLQEVSRKDTRFQGTVVACRSSADDLNIPVESIQVYWEVNSQTSNNFKVHWNADSVSVNSEPNNLNSSFKHDFYEAVKNTIKTFTFKSHSIWLSYPSIKKSIIGPTLHLVMYDSGKTRLISVLLVPLLKVDYPEENRETFVHSIIKECSKKEIAYLANLEDEKWTFVSVRLEDEIFKQLSEDQRQVLIGCKLLTRMLYSCWWFPKAKNRRHSRTWHAYAFGISTLPDMVLTSLFLEEINSTTSEDWYPSKFLDRMIAIFRRAVEDTNGSMKPKDTVRLFLNCKHSSFKPSHLVCTIIQFLENLKKGKYKI